MSTKANAKADLAGLLPTGSSKDDKAIQKAIDAIDDSLNPDYWADDAHLTDDGKKVFDEEKKAVKELGKVKGGASAAAGLTSPCPPGSLPDANVCIPVPTSQLPDSALLARLQAPGQRRRQRGTASTPL